jgi:hypothetical protein
MDRGFAMAPDAPVITSVLEMSARFSAELTASLPDWETRLKANADDLEQIEREVHSLTSRGADMVVCGLLSVAMRDPATDEASGTLRKEFSYPLNRGRDRKVRVRLLSGLVVWMCSLYCQPKRRLFAKKDVDEPGLYIDAAQFGITDGVSPALSSRVARQAALCPSFEFAHEELSRSGVTLDPKTVRRIAYQLGEKLLRWRKLLIDKWRVGLLPAGDELSGKSVSVQIDGGRAKIRGKLRPARKRKLKRDEDDLVIEDAPGRSKKVAKREYDTDWRKPKLLTIFVHDENGKMDKQFEATIDGTLLGPDAIAELAAMHLHRLGAAKSKSVTFCADGAPWIWDRVPMIVEKAGLKEVPIHEVLDNCHAAHHISLALAALGLDDEQRMALYRDQRTRLRNGQWKRVVEELRELAEDELKESKVHTEIAYLEKHGQAGRLNYVQFTKHGIPLGSGAIESSIRRVLNLRMKNNATFWLHDNAEIMLQLRAQVISKQWDARVKDVRAMCRYDARTDWGWEPGPMSSKDEANLTTSV